MILLLDVMRDLYPVALFSPGRRDLPTSGSSSAHHDIWIADLRRGLRQARHSSFVVQEVGVGGRGLVGRLEHHLSHLELLVHRSGLDSWQGLVVLLLNEETQVNDVLVPSNEVGRGLILVRSLVHNSNLWWESGDSVNRRDE